MEPKIIETTPEKDDLIEQIKKELTSARLDQLSELLTGIHQLKTLLEKNQNEYSKDLFKNLNGLLERIGHILTTVAQKRVFENNIDELLLNQDQCLTIQKGLDLLKAIQTKPEADWELPLKEAFQIFDSWYLLETIGENPIKEEKSKSEDPVLSLPLSKEPLQNNKLPCPKVADELLSTSFPTVRIEDANPSATEAPLAKASIQEEGIEPHLPRAEVNEEETISRLNQLISVANSIHSLIGKGHKILKKIRSLQMEIPFNKDLNAIKNETFNLIKLLQKQTLKLLPVINNYSINEKRERVLIVGNGNFRCALPLNRIKQIIRRRITEIKLADGKMTTEFQGIDILLKDLREVLNIKDESKKSEPGARQEIFPIIILSDKNQGILVERIFDIEDLIFEEKAGRKYAVTSSGDAVWLEPTDSI